MAWFGINIAGKPTAPDYLASLGYSFATINNVDSVWAADQAEADAIQALVDAYDPLPVAKAATIARINREAALRTEAAVPSGDRDIAIVRMMTLVAKNIASSLNQAERAQLTALRDSIAPIVPVASARDAALAAVAAMTDVSAVNAFDETDPALWP